MLNRITFVAVIVGIAYFAAAAPPATQPDDGHSFDVAMNKGEYVFIGMETGTKGKDPLDQGTEPIAKFHILPNADMDRWNLHIVVQTDTDENGKMNWKFDANLQTKWPDGSVRNAIGVNWVDIAGDHTDVQNLSIQEIDASKDINVEGLKYYKIVFSKMDGETHYAVIAVAKSIDPFKKAFTIPKTYVIFQWKRWADFK